MLVEHFDFISFRQHSSISFYCIKIYKFVRNVEYIPTNAILYTLPCIDKSKNKEPLYGILVWKFEQKKISSKTRRFCRPICQRFLRSVSLHAFSKHTHKYTFENTCIILASTKRPIFSCWFCSRFYQPLLTLLLCMWASIWKKRYLGIFSLC